MNHAGVGSPNRAHVDAWWTPVSPAFRAGWRFRSTRQTTTRAAYGRSAASVRRVGCTVGRRRVSMTHFGAVGRLSNTDEGDGETLANKGSRERSEYPSVDSWMSISRGTSRPWISDNPNVVSKDRTSMRPQVVAFREATISRNVHSPEPVGQHGGLTDTGSGAGSGLRARPTMRCRSPICESSFSSSWSSVGRAWGRITPPSWCGW